MVCLDGASRDQPAQRHPDAVHPNRLRPVVHRFGARHTACALEPGTALCRRSLARQLRVVLATEHAIRLVHEDDDRALLLSDG